MSGSSPGTSGRDPRESVANMGGRGKDLAIMERGAAAEVDCAQGAVGEPLVLDKEGWFEATGTIVRDQPGPQSILKPPVTEKARYSGQVAGDQMTLTVILAETEEKFGTFALEFGA